MNKRELIEKIIGEHKHTIRNALERRLEKYSKKELKEILERRKRI